MPIPPDLEHLNCNPPTSGDHHFFSPSNNRNICGLLNLVICPPRALQMKEIAFPAFSTLILPSTKNASDFPRITIQSPTRGDEDVTWCFHGLFSEEKIWKKLHISKCGYHLERSFFSQEKHHKKNLLFY